MLGPIQTIRLLRIYLVMMRHGFNPTVVSRKQRFLRGLSYLNIFSYGHKAQSRGESVRLGLEKLGPIFVKFGQLLSTRGDIIPDDIAQELSKLQDQVPPFSGDIAVKTIEKAFGKPITKLFPKFDRTPLASASIAQVHTAELPSGQEVVVKVLRPRVEKVIGHDIAIMYSAARLLERFWKQGKRLHLVDLVAEFEHTIIDELDLMREAANASQLRRNFRNSDMLYVPKVYWQYTRTQVMVMERIYGIQISNIDELKRRSTNLKKLGEHGVEIFFTQVFRDSFFHADMHPGNLFVDVSDPENPKYLGVDFGIMGTLSPIDQHYLAANIVAFFNRDYREVAILHVQSGWVPPETRVDQFESAIRTVCEPVFEKPLSEISFGQALLRLFQTAERFHMEIQPQLMLLQKTLLAIEGLGRMVYPELDLWATAKPYMQKWMSDQKGLRHLGKLAKSILPDTLDNIMRTPKLAFEVLQHVQQDQRHHYYERMSAPEVKKTSWLRSFLCGSGITLGLMALAIYFFQHPMSAAWAWVPAVLAGLLLLLAWLS